MPEKLPDDFESEDELAQWFDAADMSLYQLDPARDVAIASHVTLVIEENLTPPSTTAAATGDTHLELVHS